MNLQRVIPNLLILLIAGISFATSGGCSENAQLASVALAPTTAPALLAAGDSLELKFYYAPELNVTEAIRPDGMLTLELVGEVPAAGFTPTQLTDDLEKRYSKFLIHSDVAVFVRSAYARKIYVTGAVVKPGVIEMPGNMSALEAVMMSGGFDLTKADATQVLVIRDDGKGGRSAYALNLADAISGNRTQSFMLQQQDIVYVPRTFIVDVDQFVSQYINSILPEGLLYTTPIGRGALSVGSNNIVGQQ
jgi:protein involved in polysaccharide export with SLBB domain